MFALEVTLAVLVPVFIAYVIYRVLCWRKAKKELAELDQRIAELELATENSVFGGMFDVLQAFGEATAKLYPKDTEATRESSTVTD